MNPYHCCDRRALLSLAFGLAIMAGFVIWHQLQPKPGSNLVQEAGQMQLAGKYSEAIALATQAIDKGEYLALAHFIRASCIYQRTLVSGIYSAKELDMAETDYCYALKHTDQKEMKDNCANSLIVIYSLRETGTAP